MRRINESVAQHIGKRNHVDGCMVRIRCFQRGKIHLAAMGAGVNMNFLEG